MNLGFKNRKGNVVLDSMMVLIVLVVFGIISVLAYITMNDLTTDIVADPDISDATKDNLSSLNSRMPSTLDGAFALALGLLWLLVIVSSFLIDAHPAFFIVSIILLIALLFAASLISNAYEEFETDAEYSSAASEFPMTSYIMKNFLIVILIIGGSVALVLFGKNRLT